MSLDIPITFSIHGTRALWIQTRPWRDVQNDAIYRVYIDDDLITERTWIWDNNIFLKENIWIRSEAGSQHTLKIVPVINKPNAVKFAIDNLIVNKTLVPTNGNLEVSFEV